VKKGFLKDVGDLGGGIIGLIISLILLSVGMICLCMMLKRIFIGKAKKLIRLALQVNDYVAILIGMVITIIVQSSSVCTSALTPLAGIGVLSLEKMLPLTLGANIGTTCTALIASLVSLKFGAVQIAMVHLCFNITGIFIWFPFPPMRQIPLNGARLLGLYASYFRAFPAIYIFVIFVCVPGMCLGVSELFKASVGGGVVVLLILLAMIGVTVFAWLRGVPLNKPPILDGTPLCFKVLSKEQRTEGVRALAMANEQVREVGVGETSSQPAAELEV
jgi:sodium-dependent phosphate cotransporter